MKFAVIVFPGSNCDRDMYHAVKEVLGAEADLVWYQNSDLQDYDGILLPGGFSYGDYLRSGLCCSNIGCHEPSKGACREGKASTRCL